MSYVLSCCSTLDLKKEHLERINASYVCFHYMLDGVDYPDDLGQSISFDEFYNKLKNGSESKTSMISVGEYVDYFESMLKAGKDILHISLSSGVSGSYRSAVTAADMLKADYPDRKIYVIDSLAASSGYGLLVDAAAQKRDEGLTIDELNLWVEENKLRLHHWFFSSDLTFFVKGGRVSKVSGMIGGVFDICPLLNVSNEGKLIARSKVRTKKKVIAEIVNRMEQFADNRLDYNGKVFMSCSDCYDDANAVADLIRERFKKIDGDILINDIGTVIGSHTGPGTVALFFWGDKRVD
ncbi:MAG: DegV family protein [Eubacteriales bacterium]|nr:DegV family protein [Eubacteriales bacterium]